MRRFPAVLVPCALALLAVNPARSDDPVATGAPPGPPNFLVDVSACLVDAAVRRPVDRVTPVSDFIVETPFQGLARTVGQAHAELVPDPHHAAVDLVLDGTVCSRTVGYPLFAIIYTAATAPVEARYRVCIGSEGIQTVPGPAFARASTVLLGATSRDGDPGAPAACLARAGFEESKWQAEAEISEHTAAQLSEQMGCELAPQLARAGEAVGTALGKARQFGLDLQGLHFSTTCDDLRLAARVATPGQPEPAAPPGPAAGADLGVRMHQSVFNQMTRALLGGKNLTPDEVIKKANDLSGLLFKDGRPQGEQDKTGLVLAKLLKALGQPVKLTMARRDPVVVTFAGRQAVVDVHVARVTVGSEKLPDLRIRAVYRLEGSAALRKGAMTIQQQGGLLAAALRPVIDALFGEVLREHWELLRQPLPASGGPPASLRAAHLSSRDGWLVLGWNLEPGPVR